MNRKKHTIGIALVLLLALIAPPVWSVYREIRQARLDHALIEAFKAGKNHKALEALAEGANGEARDTKFPTCQEAMLQRLNRFRNPGTPPSNSVGKDECLPALLLLLHTSDARSGLNLGVVQSLLDHGAKINDRNAFGMTALNLATGRSDVDLVRLLLEQGADTEAANDEGITPLMESQTVAITTVLLEHGANLEAKDSQGQTAFFHAVMDNNIKVMRILHERGADLNARDAQGHTAFGVAMDDAEHTDAEVATSSASTARISL